MDWPLRLKIALGAARGLAYLHSSPAVGVPIVHSDFKSSNILLSEFFEAKISDFGLAKLMPEDAYLYSTTRVLGTFGYLDPEYALRAMLVPKEVLKIKKKNPVLQIKIGSKPMQKEIAERENNTKELAREEEHLQQRHFATPQEIESGKLPPEELLSLPMFKEMNCC